MVLMRDAVIAQIRHIETRPVPYVLEFDKSVADSMDAVAGNKDWRTRVQPYIVKIKSVDSEQNVRLDSTHCQDAFGSIWRTDLRPLHLEHPGLPEPSFAGYTFPQPEQFLDAAMAQSALRKCNANPSSFRAALIGWGLFERSWTIRGFQEVLMDSIAEPEFYEDLLDHIVELQLAFVAETIKLPFDGVMFSDDWGDQRGVILGPDRWRRFIKPRLAKLYQAVHDAGKITLNHCCGNIEAIIPDLIEIGLDVLQCIQPEAMNPYELKRKWGDQITFWGGLGSQSTIPFGSPGEITHEIKQLCAEMGKDGGYILGPAKPLQPGTAPENAFAVLEAFTNQL